MNTERRSPSGVFWGVILVAAGVLLLTQTLGLLPNPSGGVIGTALAVAGLGILASYLALRTHWWTLIAGPTLLAVGAVILLPGNWGGTILLGGIGLGFVLVVLTGARRWWATIPAGTLLTLALIAQLSDVIGGRLSGTVLFFGLAATFGVLALIPVETHRMRWPQYPALGWMLFGLLIATGTAAAAVLWPILLVASGLFLLIRASTRHAGPRELGS